MVGDVTTDTVPVSGEVVVGIRYDRDADHLHLWFGETPRPAYGEPVSAYESVRRDFETGEIVGYEVERFVARAVYELPHLLPLLDVIGLKRRDIERIKQQIAPEQRQRVAVDAVMHRLVQAHA